MSLRSISLSCLLIIVSTVGQHTFRNDKLHRKATSERVQHKKGGLRLIHPLRATRSLHAISRLIDERGPLVSGILVANPNKPFLLDGDVVKLLFRARADESKESVVETKIVRQAVSLETTSTISASKAVLQRGVSSAWNRDVFALRNPALHALTPLLFALQQLSPARMELHRKSVVTGLRPHNRQIEGRMSRHRGSTLVHMRSSTAPTLHNGKAVRDFLLGQWHFNRSLDYKIGGGKGTMVGKATFTETPELGTALLYEEVGQVHLEGFQKPVEAYRRYLFNTAKWPVEVYFVDDVTKKHLTSLLSELDYHTSFFIPLPFEISRSCSISLASDDADMIANEGAKSTFEHLCVDDLYSGSFRVRSSDRFDWHWSVKGPNKDGDIQGTYLRLLHA